MNGVVKYGTSANMYDLMGRRVRSVNLDPYVTNSFRIDELNRGLYIIHVVDETGIQKAERVFVE